ncbi:MAG: hypothetical protein QOE90_2460 [Thermoplasmata archaeon]|nr:hypothetical protein [Thermoplasmata archaeon]
MRRLLAATIALVALAGCLTAPTVQTARVAPPALPAWHEATRLLDLPAGDSFGALLVTFDAGDVGKPFGAPAYGLAFERPTMGDQDFIEADLFGVKDGNATWIVTGSSFGHGVTALSLPPLAGGGPPTALFVLFAHLAHATTLRAGAWTTSEFPPTLPNATVAGAWTRAGPAQVSYFVSGYRGTAFFSESHDVTQSGTGTGPTAPLSAGAFSLATRHAAGGLSLSTGMVRPTAGAGTADVSWTSGGKTQRGAAPFATTPAGGQIADFLAAGASPDASAAELDLTGASALDTVILTHVTGDFDAAELGIAVTPQYRGPASLLATGACLRASPAAACET